MALIQKRGLASNSVDGSKIQISNNEWLRFRNEANLADLNFVKLNTSDEFELAYLPKFETTQVATEEYVDNAVAQLSSAFVYEGAWDADTNTPTLVDGVGKTGSLYRVSVAGTVDFGSGNITFEVGDKVIYNGTIWEKWDVIDNEFATSSTDNLTEGTTNLYFTDERAKTAAVVNSMAGSETDQAPSVSSVKQYIDDQSANIAVETFVLTSGDITNGFIELTQVADFVIEVTPKGFPVQHPVDDYSLSVVASKTRITFEGDMLSLVSGDKIKVAYSI